MTSALLSPQQAIALLHDPDTNFVDGSWHMPGSDQNAAENFAQAHIPGAVRFDIDAIADQTSPLPHMMPSPEQFATQCGALGLAPNRTLIIYETGPLFTAPRVWWSLKAMGAENVFILDGGLSGWQAQGGPISDSPTSPTPRPFAPNPATDRFVTLDQMRQIIHDQSALIFDARSPERFLGQTAEPRPGLPSGHMKGAINIPYQTMLAEGRLKSPDRLVHLFQQKGWDGTRPAVASCGSGVTACLIALAAYEAFGCWISVYDGSWVEWASAPNTPIENRFTDQ